MSTAGRLVSKASMVKSRTFKVDLISYSDMAMPIRHNQVKAQVFYESAVHCPLIHYVFMILELSLRTDAVLPAWSVPWRSKL